MAPALSQCLLAIAALEMNAILLTLSLLLMFDASAEMMEIGILALRFVAAAFLFTTTTQILSGFLQAMGQGTASFIVAIAQTVFMLLFAWILAQTKSATLVWLAFPIMEVVRFIIAVILVKHTYKGKIAGLQPVQAV